MLSYNKESLTFMDTREEIDGAEIAVSNPELTSLNARAIA